MDHKKKLAVLKMCRTLIDKCQDKVHPSLLCMALCTSRPYAHTQPWSFSCFLEIFQIYVVNIFLSLLPIGEKY